MKIVKSLIALSITGFMSLNAQTNILSLDQLTPGSKSYLRVDNLRDGQWYGDTFTIRKDNGIYTVDERGNVSDKPLITLNQLNEAIEIAGLKTLKGLPQMRFSDKIKVNGKSGKFAILSIEDKVYAFNYSNNTLSEIFRFDKELQGNHEFNPNTTFAAINKNNLLFVTDANGNTRQISDSDDKNVVWGQSVHRNEFGIEKGTFWSPNGDLLAFYRMDESMVTDYPLVDVTERVAALNNIKYPMAGMTSHEVLIGIYNTATGKTIYLNTGEPKDRYFTNIAWAPDQKLIYVAELNREQNHMDLKAYDAATGNYVKTLFSESSDKYVEPQNPMRFVPGKQELFIWESQRDGFNHFYLYNTEGKLINQITKGEWIVLSFKDFDKNGENIYYMSTEVSPIEQHLYKVNIKSGKRTRLTNAEGMHYVSLNNSKTAFSDRYSSQFVPGKTDLVKVSNQKATNIHTASNPYEGYEYPEIKLGTIKAADDSTELHYRLTLPLGCDTTKYQYPVVVYLYNGPHAQLIHNSWCADIRGWDVYMAQKGYIVLTVDGRGSANRGRDFEQTIFHKLGHNEGKDQMKGIDMLRTLPYVDQNRIGIHGWSYGGFMTTYMMLTYPETFKVGVAGGPVIDWNLYEIMYGERYMGHPEKNPEGYAYSNLLNKTKNLQGRLMLIHGDVDPVVVLQHSLNFLKQAVNDNVYPDYFIYPGHQHNVLGPDRVHLFEKISRYFDDYLGNEPKLID